VPLIPAPYARQLLTEDMLTTRTSEAHAWALTQFKTFKGGGLYVPLSVDKQTIIFPGFDGGAEWGGSAVDPRNGVVYINSNDIAWTGGLTAAKTGGSLGARTYDSQCAVCHGTDRSGSPPAFPSLVKVTSRLSDDAITTVIHSGKGRMPSFPSIEGESLTSMLDYLKTDPSPQDGQHVTASAANPPGGDRTEVAGASLYEDHCAICHSDDLMGTVSNDPGLIGVRQRMSDERILTIVHNGKGRMPAFPMLSTVDDARLLRFLGKPAEATKNEVAESPSSKEEMGSTVAGRATKYRFTGYRKFLDPDGYPAVAPPWGTLNAIDLNTGKYLWKIPLGEYPELAATGMTNTGTENYGGPIVTASGLVIIASTIFDRKIRAFDSKDGKLLWEAELPYAGNATPATYMVDGKQYIVIATSAKRDPKARQGSAYVAFALP
jgi:mono/diheme cytochrome c family protein